MTHPRLLLFVDSNVLVEALFLQRSAAAAVIDQAINGTFQIATCQEVIDDVEEAILSKMRGFPEYLDGIVRRWEKLKTESGLSVMPG